MFVSQLVPEKPGKHEHVRVFTPSVHNPPFWHGLIKHSLMFVPQVGPEKPGAHVHEALPPTLAHVPPFEQGFGLHGSVTPVTARKLRLSNVM
jgi:hypothetical protein